MQKDLTQDESDSLRQFIGYLNDTLIPDLKESGRVGTAEDLETAAFWLRRLSSVES
jgi:hypothetical protein